MLKSGVPENSHSPPKKVWEFQEYTAENHVLKFVKFLTLEQF